MLETISSLHLFEQSIQNTSPIEIILMKNMLKKDKGTCDMILMSKKLILNFSAYA